MTSRPHGWISFVNDFVDFNPFWVVRGMGPMTQNPRCACPSFDVAITLLQGHDHVHRPWVKLTGRENRAGGVRLVPRITDRNSPEI